MVGKKGLFELKKRTVSGLKRQFDKWHLFSAPTERSTREIWQSKLRDGELTLWRDIVNQLQDHLAETHAQVDDWSFWYDQEYGSEYEMVQEDQDDEGETAEVNQVQPVLQAPQQSQSTPVTPPVLQGNVPAE